MKKIKYIILLSILFLFSGCEDTHRDKKIIFGISPIPPFAYLDKDKNLSGFSIELSEKISSILGKKMEIQILNLCEAIPALNNDIIDTFVDIVKIKEGEKNFLFSKSYINNKFYS